MLQGPAYNDMSFSLVPGWLGFPGQFATAAGRQDAIPGHGGCEDHRSIGRHVGHHRINHLFHVPYIADGNLHHEGLGAGDAMALQNFRQRLYQRGKFGELVPGYGDFHEGANGEPHPSGIDHGAISENDVVLFQPANALNNCGCR